MSHYLFRIKSLVIGCLLSLSTFCSSPAWASDAFVTYGNITQIALPVSAGLVSLFKGDYQGLKQFSYSFLLTMAVTYTLKSTVDERRPNGGHWSFPSGHTAAAFSASSYLWMRYGSAYGIPATVLAAAVGYSRVESKHHYWHDVLFGAAIGTLSSYLFTKSINVNVSSGNVSVSYTHHFA